MKTKKSILFILIILVLLFMTGVSACELNDTSISSGDDMHIELAEIDNDSKAAQEDNQPIEQSNSEEIISEGDDGSFAALQSKIDNAPDNSTIKLENDYEQSGSATGYGIEIRKPITIDGQGKTIDAKGKIRFFYIKSNDVVLKNIIFINGFFDSTAGGAAIWSNRHNTIIYNCTFMNNYAKDMGGALFLKGDNSVVSNCSFIDNYARDNGGAIRLYGDNSVVSNCSFVNNSAGGDGGAICLSGSYSVVSNCSFVNSSSPKDSAGAIYFSGSYGVVSNCSFVNISSKNDGGAIYFSGNGGVVSNCSFVNSSSENEGGAIYWYSKGGTVSDCSFVNSSSGRNGGAVYWHDDKGSISNCSFVNSITTYNYGGAIYLHGNDGFVSNCSFVNSSSVKKGGAIYWDGDGFVSNCSFVNSISENGSAIYWHGFKGSVSVCSFVNCSAGNGGAVYWHGNRSDVFDCSFVNCSAGNGGGAVYFSGDKGTVSNCSFIYGSGVYGGAIYLNGTNSSISTCIFVNNTADMGIIHFENVNEENISHFKINDNIFLNNAGLREITFNQIDNNSNADYNWFGNNANDYSKQPNSVEEISDTWLFLNATVNPNTIKVFNSTEIFIKLYSYNSTSGNISEYDYNLLKPICLSLAAARGIVNVTHVGLFESFKFTATSGGIGSVTATMENIDYIIEFKITKIASKLTADNLSITYKDGSGWTATLTDEDNNAICDAVVKIGVHIYGVDKVYALKTDEYGIAILPINLIPGSYPINATFEDDDEVYESSFTNATVTVGKAIATLSADNLVMNYKDGSCWTVSLNDYSGEAIKNVYVDVGIAGKVYRIRTNGSGFANLAINLNPGPYDVNASLSNTIYEAEMIFATVTVEKAVLILSADDLVMSYRDGSSYNVTLTDDKDNPIANNIVKFNISDKIYSIKTDAKGVASLPINLAIGNYSISAKFEENSRYHEIEISNTITVNKPELSIVAEDLNMTYKDGTRYSVQLTDSNGNPVALAGEAINITVNGKTYQRKTNSEGIASLPINLVAGTYEIASEYDGKVLIRTLIVNKA